MHEGVFPLEQRVGHEGAQPLAFIVALLWSLHGCNYAHLQVWFQAGAQTATHVLCILCEHTVLVASYPAFMDGRKEYLVSAICACVKFSQKSGKPCYFGILPCNGHLQWQRQRVLISFGLMHILHRWRIQCLEAIDEWPCGDCFTFYSTMLHDDVLIENNKYAMSLAQ